MQFKHPEILYFLFLLVIPIIVHLFQLRKFKKTYFTNVKLLKELQQQTRKSSQLKKWLLLATRLLLLTFLILAFAQPFFNANDATNKANELVVVLDNSFSMQAKGANGELLKKAVQDILENIPEEQNISIVTPSTAFWDTNVKAIQNDLQKLSYTSYSFEPDYLLTQIDAKKRTTSKDIIFITDGLAVTSEKLKNLNTENTFVSLVKAENTSNCAVENVKISGITEAFYELTIDLKRLGTLTDKINVTVSENEKTVAKTQLDFKNLTESIKINIPKKAFHGKVEINDTSLAYDNTFYFTITEPKKPNVLIIGDAKKNNFLKRIFTTNDFNTTETPLSGLNYNSIQDQQTIVLNEIEDIPEALSNTLDLHYKNGGTIVFIPSEKTNVSVINSALKKWANLQFGNLNSSEKLITTIDFKHPLYTNVFEKSVQNFQYPKVKKSFPISGNPFSVLRYDDGSNFLSSVTNKLGTIYIFSAPINTTNSNFQNSPLIVPTIYNMGINNGNLTTLTFTISENSSLIIDAIVSKDEVLSIKNTSYGFIPMQQILNDKVKLSFGDYPEIAGNYSVYQKENVLSQLSFNYPRTESDLTQKESNVFDSFTKIDSVKEAIEKWQSNRTDTVLWKYFLLATLLFLIIELLIQKFVK